jgi:uncharacterized repeat protein (TIGR03803 family)
VAGLILDGSGALYGTTSQGGAGGCDSNSGCGVVFKLTPAQGKAAWSETVLHSFSNDGSDGWNSAAGLIIDNSGELYGTTYQGGEYSAGVLFKLTPPAAGGTTWAETVLYSFTNGSDGGGPGAGLIMDSSGSLYGTTEGGGVDSRGAAFELTR